MAIATSRRCASCASRHTCTLASAKAFRRDVPSVPPAKTVFKRELPSDLVAFSSPAGRSFFMQAMQSNEMEPFFPLSEQFTTQEEPTYCALGTLTMCMNALNVDPQRRWRDASGPGWRWWADEMFAPASSCLPSLESVRRDGVSLRGFTQIASASGAAVKQHQPSPAGHGTEESFRASLAAAAASPDSFAVVNFCRTALGQTGSGHFSPIGGYHRASDSVLILDVARFKYPPYWVPVPLLWDAVTAVDELSGSPRGWVTLEAAAEGEYVGEPAPAATAEPHHHAHLDGCSCSGCGGTDSSTAGFPR